ncbi:copper chaperone [Imshaugia aleurites]|uniref:Superoxide dismutase 1 copper chaperone n=1 Tax=Imshaugia aleurites TaxID=172621 RepID=A0A8H3G3Z9_9LECA|nr:copper chaperone [Imshaugia aleurites]
MSKLLLRRSISTSVACLSTGALYYTFSPTPLTKREKMQPTYQATFSVPMHCNNCVEDISGALSTLPGVQNTDFSLPKQLLIITSTTPPSAIISTIQDTGRTAILRGSGKANSAAVCILETPPSPTPPSVPEASPIRGLARLIELSDRITLLDMTLTGLSKGSYNASIRQSGDISNVPGNMGGVFKGVEGDRMGELGKLEVDETGRGSLVGEIDWRVWEMVGRGIVVERLGRKEGGDELVIGVVARSAGVWENEKVVCGCSGKTVWEEREEMVGKGIS